MTSVLLNANTEQLAVDTYEKVTDLQSKFKYDGDNDAIIRQYSKDLSYLYFTYSSQFVLTPLSIIFSGDKTIIENMWYDLLTGNIGNLHPVRHLARGFKDYWESHVKNPNVAASFVSANVTFESEEHFVSALVRIGEMVQLFKDRNATILPWYQIFYNIEIVVKRTIISCDFNTGNSLVPTPTVLSTTGTIFFNDAGKFTDNSTSQHGIP